MKKYINIIKETPLFEEVCEEDFSSLLQCLSTKTKNYKKNEVIFSIGDSAKHIGIVLSGKVQIEKNDYYGNRNILAVIEQGHLFGESFVCADISTFPVNVISIDSSSIMFIDYRKIITTCANACPFHNKLIFNMLKIVAQKNILLNQKIEFISKRTTRKKLLTYLSHQATKSDNDLFSIPFNRQELADFLCVDRSAMSSELCKMRDEGIIEFHKNTFKLL